MLVKDRSGRVVKSLRLSLTQRCNQACFYCHQEGQKPSNKEISLEEIEHLAKLAAKLNILKVKLTGGEPLLRKDIVEIVKVLAQSMDEVSLTTNGTLLDKYAAQLKESGLKRVNISLDTLDPKKYLEITGSNLLAQAVSGIKAAYKNELFPLKINFVLLKGINDNELNEMIDFVTQYSAILQIIELEPRSLSFSFKKRKRNPSGKEKENDVDIYNKYHFDLSQLERYLESKAMKLERNVLHNRKRYFINWDSSIAQLELVKPMHNSEFCRNCTRIRITSDGKLKPCLFRNESYEFASLIREGATEEKLLEIFKNAVVNRAPYWR